MPYVKSPRKLQQVLQANSGDYFPMSTSGDYVFAYNILEDYLSRDDGRRMYRISAVAAPMDLIRCYYELAEDLKLSVKHIDYFGNSVIQLLSMQMQEGRTDLVLAGLHNLGDTDHVGTDVDCQKLIGHPVAPLSWFILYQIRLYHNPVIFSSKNYIF